ncbi:MAG: recombination mediator RecR [Planctomycetota bacterium]|nr:recombination mediator RecR [Planctomycetota bacterium]
MARYSPTVRNLIELFGELPGIGSKTAERLAFHLLNCEEEYALALADGIRAVKEKIIHCSICNNLCESSPCEICSDSRRSDKVLCVVETPKDLASIENSVSFEGKYHVLGGSISPLNDIGPEDLAIDSLVERVEKDGVKEVIFATNPTTEGDATCYYIAKKLKGLPVKVSRLARGLPVGSELEFAPKTNIDEALRGRQEF